MAYRAPRIEPDEQRSYVPPPPPRIPRPAEPVYDSEDGDDTDWQPPKKAPRRRFGWMLLKWSILLGVWSGFVLAGVLVYFAWDLPRPEAALDAQRRPSLTLADSRGKVIASYGDVVGEPLRLVDLPKFMPAAAVAVEDRRFWRHPGIDLIGILRASYVNLRAGHLVQGGSTLTQQVAKNLFLTNARTAKRKVQELMLTLWLEHSFSKTEILEIWLNRVYLGSGAWGVDAAAQMYFGMSARNLNLWQSAVIAGLPRAPSRFSPRVDPHAAAARGRDVLAAMAETGVITPDQAREAGAAIAFPAKPPTGAGWFAEWAAERIQAEIPSGADAVLQTTLDSRLQDLVEQKLQTLLDGPGLAAGVGQGAVVVLDVATGAVRAMAGGRDYRSSPYNRAVIARRQPGSAFKPFVWLTALEHGERADDLVLDAPIRLGTWSPSNFDLKFRGEITLEEALAESVNTAAVRLLLQSGGPAAVMEMAHRLGISSKLAANASLALGTSEVRLIELAGAYATIFNGGRLVSPYAIESAHADGKPVALPEHTARRVIDGEIAQQMTRMMTAVVTRGSGKAAAIPGRIVAGKTGTTQDFHDAWFIGAAGPVVIGVWLGNDDNRPMLNITGGSLPARLFHDIALELR